ncbi:MAG: hypothetical protein M3321_01250 [Actinomycetota bacterium]|nr:hypothetical protein [Actinomycetota bacterium]
MSEIVEIPLADLLLNVENPRLVETQQTQQDTARELAARQGDALLRLAHDIVEHGTDPTTLVAVVPTGERHKRYLVVEGNRRVLALRALESPSLVASAFTASRNRKLASLAKRYAANPVERVTCVLFASEDEARHWVELRHTGQNLGAGLVEWGAEEKDRFQARHSGQRNRAGQVLDFVQAHGSLTERARTSNVGVLTNLDRLLTPYVRDRLGLDLQDGRLVALYPKDQIAPALTKVVEDLKTQKIAVRDIYRAADARKYVDDLPTRLLPKKSKALKEPVLLDDLTTGKATPAPVKKQATPKPKPRPRTTVVPEAAKLNVTPPRINSIYVELSSLNAERFPNAGSVLLRVFIELSVDHYIEGGKLMSDAQMRSTPLAKRLKRVVENLKSRNKISAQLATAMESYADGKMTIVAASVATFNQYVHNQYVYPKAADLYTTWDELTPLLEKMWP